MNPIAVIKEFLHKARLEAQRDYQVKPAAKENGDSKRHGQLEEAPQGWIGMDLDGTLARSDTLVSMTKIGDPVPKMVTLVNRLIKDGHRVKIFTARAAVPEQIPLIRAWLKEHGLPAMEITNVKDFSMIRLYDDRAVQVLANTGELVVPVGEKRPPEPD